MRTQRAFSIQTWDQYYFCYTAVIEYAQRNGKMSPVQWSDSDIDTDSEWETRGGKGRNANGKENLTTSWSNWGVALHIWRTCGIFCSKRKKTKDGGVVAPNMLTQALTGSSSMWRLSEVTSWMKQRVQNNEHYATDWTNSPANVWAPLSLLNCRGTWPALNPSCWQESCSIFISTCTRGSQTWTLPLEPSKSLILLVFPVLFLPWASL